MITTQVISFMSAVEGNIVINQTVLIMEAM